MAVDLNQIRDEARADFENGQFTHTQAVAGMAWADIASSAYRAYAASTGNKNFRGDPMPAFSDLPQSIQVAWEAAVRQVGNCISAGAVGPAEGSEQRWSGWLPPQMRERSPLL